MKVLSLQVGNESNGATLVMNQAVLRWAASSARRRSLRRSGRFRSSALLGLVSFVWFLVLLYTTWASPTKQGLHDKYAAYDGREVGAHRRLSPARDRSTRHEAPTGTRAGPRHVRRPAGCAEAGADRWDRRRALRRCTVHRVLHRPSTGASVPWISSRTRRPISWTTALRDPSADRICSSCPKGPAGTAGAEITSRLGTGDHINGPRRRSHQRRSRPGRGVRREGECSADGSREERRDHIKAVRAEPELVPSGASMPASGRTAPGGTRPASRCRYSRRAWRLPPGRTERVSTDHARPIHPADLPERLDALEAAVRARTPSCPRVGIVLGSGLGGLADDLDDPVAIPFAELPGWPAATAPGHVGRLLLGSPRRRPRRRCSRAASTLYEGHLPGLVVQPVLLMGRLGARDRSCSPTRPVAWIRRSAPGRSWSSPTTST